MARITRFIGPLVLTIFFGGCATEYHTVKSEEIRIPRSPASSKERNFPKGLIAEIPASGRDEYQCLITFESVSSGSLVSRFAFSLGKDTNYVKVDPPGSASPILIEEGPRSAIVASFWGAYGDFHARFYRRSGQIFHYDDGQPDFDGIERTEFLAEIFAKGKNGEYSLPLDAYKLRWQCKAF